MGLIFFAILGLYGVMDYSARYPLDLTSNDATQAGGYKFVRPQQELSNFSYDVRRSGTHLYSLSGQKFTVQKKKIGIFRFGLIKEAVISQAFFHFTFPKKNDTDAKDKFEQDLSLLIPDPSYIVSGLVCKPISLIIDREEQENSDSVHIAADYAEIQAGSRAVNLHGKVKMTSGSVSLETDELDLYLGDDLIEVAHSYKLVQKSAKVFGHGLRSDIFLHSIVKAE